MKKLIATALLAFSMTFGAAMLTASPAQAASCVSVYDWKAKNNSCSYSIKHTLVFSDGYIRANSAAKGSWSDQKACYPDVISRGWVRA
jgi:hypothetical protein